MTTEPTAPALQQQIARLKAALKPFATARISKDAGGVLSGWPEHQDSDGVELVWDPDFENGATLTIGQFKRAKAAWEEV